MPICVSFQLLLIAQCSIAGSMNPSRSGLCLNVVQNHPELDIGGVSLETKKKMPGKGHKRTKL